MKFMQTFRGNSEEYIRTRSSEKNESPTFLPCGTDRVENDTSNSSLVISCVNEMGFQKKKVLSAVTVVPRRCLATILYTEIYRRRLIGGFYEIRR